MNAASASCRAAIDACADAKIASFGSMARELAEYIWAPSYRVLNAVIEQDAKAYREQLAKALEAHPRYYDLDEERQLDPQGLFSLPLTGIASLAHDRNLHDPAIRSPLIPEYMVVGAFRADG
jgi:membrane-bound lytic murein transglycosylase